LAALDAFIEPRLYRKISSRIPIVCIDLVIRDQRERYLLVRRKNHPLRGHWWVVGGRILLREHPVDAVYRKALEETGREAVNPRLFGVMSDVYERNRFDRCECHSVSVVYQCALDDGPIKLDSQSSAYKWSDKLPERFLSRLEAF
jgi:colanic acid biosynthesis protein WcaH